MRSWSPCYSWFAYRRSPAATPSGLRILVGVKFQQFNQATELRHGVEVGISTPRLATDLQKLMALAREVFLALGQIARLDREMMEAGAFLVQQVPPGARLPARLDDFEFDIPEIQKRI